MGRGQHSSNRVSGISTRTMHQSTTPSLSQIIWPRWVPRQFFTLPIVQTLLPVTAHRLSLWDNWDERSCDEGHWHVHSRGLLQGLPEVVGTVQQVNCSRRRLLRRGLEFHVCTINQSAHTEKSQETYLMIFVHASGCAYINTYIHTWLPFKNKLVSNLSH